MKITITKVFKSDKDKNGNPLVGKNGPYMKLAVKCQEYGDKWLSGFVGSWNANWKEGDTVEVDVIPNGEYLNLRKPDPLAKINQEIAKLWEAVRSVQSAANIPIIDDDESLVDEPLPF